MSGKTTNGASDMPPAPSVGVVRRRGRPTKRAAAVLGQAILEIALRQFLDAGFSATSMDSIAAEAGVSKRTLYDRFPSKLQLFEAALNQRATAELESFRKFETQSEPFDAILMDMAEWLVDRMLGERNIALYRLLAAEAHRAPELANYSEDKLLQPIIAALASIFRQAIDRGEAVDLPPEFLANQFLQAVCGQHVRERLYGVPHFTDTAMMNGRIRNAVRLFLNGAQPQRNRRRTPGSSVSDGGSAAARRDL